MSLTVYEPWNVMYAADGITPAVRRIGYADDAGTVTGGGGPPVGDPDRSLLTYEAYEPDVSTTGNITPTTAMQDYNSPSTTAVTIPNGAVITSKRIWGRISHAGTATITDCRIYGGPAAVTSGNTACVDCNNSRTGIAVYTDCTIIPQTPSNGRDCILGKQYELYRCRLEQGVDGAGVYSTVAASPNVNVKIKGCLIQNLLYVYPDLITTTHDDGTHNDCIQFQGGKVAEFIGNSLRATSTALAGTGTNVKKPWLIGQGYANGAGFTIQNNTGVGIDTTVKIDGNYFYGGLSHVNVKTGISFEYQRNKHYRATAQNTSPSWAGYWFRGDDLSTNNITGIDVGTNDNVWIDGPYAGTVIATPRDRGITSDSGAY